MSLSKERAKHLCSIVLAVAEGKTIQVRQVGRIPEDKWDVVNLEAIRVKDEVMLEYRIKPEPKKSWYRLYAYSVGGTEVVMSSIAYSENGMTDNTTYTESAKGFVRWLEDWQEHSFTGE